MYELHTIFHHKVQHVCNTSNLKAFSRFVLVRTGWFVKTSSQNVGLFHNICSNICCDNAELIFELLLFGYLQQRTAQSLTNMRSLKPWRLQKTTSHHTPPVNLVHIGRHIASINSKRQRTARFNNMFCRFRNIWAHATSQINLLF